MQNFSDNSSSDDEDFRSLVQGHRRHIITIENGGIPQRLVMNGDNGFEARFNGRPMDFGNISELLQQLLQQVHREEGNGNQQPASKETVDNLNEIEIQEQHYDIDGQTGEQKAPCCPI
eukprot:CAMPEP_0205806140 /NCGR_PEP_ID=MMETSP0205-20121125/9569_1 /ASSEMBLY_ACC=CAM_ASM_000278 /TAXON_ID=36767 /ORGANISM="Euplotes focardii, Strain TN1" /LENGTH=117 /DNA_ID=CAMNT_0053078471 /DNA_START=318 /DNA_END=671 /DNA_ORIENTATION=-